jgi:hypothetical protein
MPFEVIETKEHTDDGHGRNYSAKHTVTTTYKHPKDLLFKHVHEDGKDCEDVYRFETVTIGDTVIGYKYDWGNYFIVEYIQIIEGERKSCVQQEYGAGTSTQHLTSKLPIFVPIDKLIERILNIHTKIIIL